MTSCLLVGCPSLGSQDHLVDDAIVREELSRADALGRLAKKGHHRELIDRLREEEERARRDSDDLMAAYVLNEMADAYVRGLGDYHKGRELNKRIRTALQRASEAGQTTSKYIGLPLIVRGFGKALRAVEGPYIRAFRNITPEDVERLVVERDRQIALRMGGEAASSTVSRASAAESAATIESALQRPMPSDQRRELLFRLAYAKSIAAPDSSAGGDVLDSALRACGLSTSDLIDGRESPLRRFLLPEQIGKVFTAVASSDEASGMTSRALQYYRIAAQGLESIRSRLLREDERIRFFRNLSSLYERIISLAVPHSPGLALVYSERARSRTLNEMLLAARDGIQFEARESAKFAALETCLNDSAGTVLADTRGIEIQQRCDQMARHLEIEFPETFQLFQVPRFSDRQLVKLVPGNQTLVSYSVLDNQVIAIVISGGTIEARTLPVTRTRLRTLVERLRQGVIADLAGGPEDRAPSDEGVFPAVRELYDLLVLPLEERIRGKVLYLSNQGELHGIPFHALIASDGVPLFERWLPVYVPSIQVLDHCHRQLRQKKQSRSLLAFGNPVYPPSFPDLPGAKEEVERIGSRAGSDALILSGTAATEAQLKTEAPGSRIVHIASHGVYDANDPMASYILLSPDQGEDGYLRPRELLEMDFYGTELMVLSACQTQVGQLREGDELIGFNRALFFAGVPNTITSQWPVNDDATSHFMVELYRRIENGADVVDAMKFAYRVSREKYPRPSHWAAFRLNGAGVMR